MTRTLFRGGYVHTPADPHATAVAVEDGHVVWTGDDDASAHFVDNADRIVDLEGKLVTPAFVDAHVHLAQTGLATQSLDLGETPTLGAALDALAAFAASSTFPIVLAHGWDETQWPENRPFTREEVDRAVGHRPAYLGRVEVHSAVISSAMLDRLPDIVAADGYDASGLVSRDAYNRAREAMFALIPDSVREEAILRALRDAAAHGIGMVHELGAPHLSPVVDFAFIETLRAAHPLPDVVGYWGALKEIETAQHLGCAGAAGDLCVDGAIGARTAAMQEPYLDAATSGHLYLDAEQVRDHVLDCTRAGIQAGFHVIGDRAAAEVVAGLRMAAEVVGIPAIVRGRHRLEHLEMVNAEDAATLGQLGIVASVQPVFDELWGGADSLYAQRLGAERAQPMNPYASLNRAGVSLAFGSDTPVSPFGPWAAVRAAAHHHNPDERLTVRAAFNAHTRGGWRAARRDEGGVIALGAPASLAVWDVAGALVVQTPDARVAAWSTDPRAGVPHLPDLHPDTGLPTCVMTLVQGRVAHEEPGALG